MVSTFRQTQALDTQCRAPNDAKVTETSLSRAGAGSLGSAKLLQGSRGSRGSECGVEAPLTIDEEVCRARFPKPQKLEDLLCRIAVED